MVDKIKEFKLQSNTAIEFTVGICRYIILYQGSRLWLQGVEYPRILLSA